MRQFRVSKSITNRESESTQRYLREITKEHLLTIEEEVRLAQQIKKGDATAKEKLVRGNLRFVVSVAKQYQNLGLPLNDLICEGNDGLLKASVRYDETRGFKFYSYAVWWIRQSILLALHEHGRLVRLPANKIDSVTKLEKTIKDLEQKYERQPTPEELAAILDVETETVENVLGITAGKHVSFDAPLGDSFDSSTLIDAFKDPNNDSNQPDHSHHNESLKEEVARILFPLNSRQREVLELYYGIGQEFPLVLDDIGEKLGITPERVRQIKDKALSKIRASKNSESLKKYLAN
jgi:RNA polymerase primary sigma factor